MILGALHAREAQPPERQIGRFSLKQLFGEGPFWRGARPKKVCRLMPRHHCTALEGVL